MVGGGVAARAREREQLLDARAACSTSSGAGGPPRPIVTTHDLAVRGEQAGEVGGDAPSSRPACRCRSRRSTAPSISSKRRVEAEVGADVGEPGGERPRGPVEALAGPSTGSSERSTTTSASPKSVEERQTVAGVRAQLLACRRRGSRRPTRRAARRAPRGRRRGHARRRSARPPSSLRRHLAARSARCTSRTRASRDRTG